MSRVAILDDEKSVRTLMGVYLKRSGHSILQCESPESVIERFREFHGEIDLLVADVGLGADSGVEIGLQLMGWSPKLKLLLISGYPFTAWSIRDAALFLELRPESVRVLQKPFTLLDMLVKVDQLIGPALTSAAAG